MGKSFVWDYQAAGDLMLRSQEIANICEREAAKMTRATGVEYVPDVRIGRKRVVARGKGKVQRKICPKCGKWHPNCNCKT